MLSCIASIFQTQIEVEELTGYPKGQFTYFGRYERPIKKKKQKPVFLRKRSLLTWNNLPSKILFY